MATDTTAIDAITRHHTDNTQLRRVQARLYGPADTAMSRLEESLASQGQSLNVTKFLNEAVRVYANHLVKKLEDSIK